MFLQKWSKPLTMAALLVSSSLYAASNPAVEAKNGMVVTSQHLASQVGVDILKLGGNAIDAAVAVGYAQAVVNPCCGNIGGGGFMTVHLADGTDTFINFRETAPAAANANMYLDAEGNVKKGASLYGYLAAGVPGTVLGMETARVKYGKLSREQVMAPAIKLAREGFILTRADTDILDTTIARFKQDPESAKIFLRADGTPLQPGDRLVQSDLANTLTVYRQRGARRLLQRQNSPSGRGSSSNKVAAS
jgi:gamma-glutamyltranspeptidase / glutathione hydrolase